MDTEQAGPASGRTESFYDGVQGTPNMVASGLAEESQRYNDKVGRAMLTPHSVLQSVMPSGNGYSEQDSQRLYPGGYVAPSGNGMSESDYEPAMRLRMLGDRGAI